MHHIHWQPIIQYIRRYMDGAIMYDRRKCNKYYKYNISSYISKSIVSKRTPLHLSLSLILICLYVCIFLIGLLYVLVYHTDTTITTAATIIWCFHVARYYFPLCLSVSTIICSVFFFFYCLAITIIEYYCYL